MDDVQCSDSLSDDEMMDDALRLEYDEPISSRIIDAVDTCSPKQDRGFPPAVHHVMDPTESALSQLLARNHEITTPAADSRLGLAVNREDITSSGTSVLAKIESIFEAMADVLLNERGQLSVELATRSRASSQHFDHTNSNPAQGIAIHRVCFPGKTEREAWRFGETIRLY